MHFNDLVITWIIIIFWAARNMDSSQVLVPRIAKNSSFWLQVFSNLNVVACLYESIWNYKMYYITCTFTVLELSKACYCECRCPQLKKLNWMKSLSHISTHFSCVTLCYIYQWNCIPVMSHAWYFWEKLETITSCGQ